MNIKLLIAVALGWILVGCAHSNKTAAYKTAAHMMDDTMCEKHEVHVGPCTGSKNNPKATLHTRDLKVTPPNVCAAPGTTLKITIQSPNKIELGSVSVTAKNKADTWLNGTNSADEDEINIPVPEWVPVDTEHDFGFSLSDGRCVDPRVTVK